MAVIPLQRPVITGTTPSYGAVSASDSFKFTDDNTFLIVKNGGAGSINAVVVVPGSKYGQNNPDITVAVPAAGERWIGPFKSDMKDDDGNITVTFSGTDTVTAALISL